MNSIRLILALAAACSISARPLYTLTDLGTLGGASSVGTGLNHVGQSAGFMTTPQGDLQAFASYGWTVQNAQANGINDAGQIAGTQFIGGQSHATLWTKGVASTVGDSGSYAMAINNSGDLAGMIVSKSSGNAFVTQKGAVVDLGAFDGGSWSAAYSLNDQGQAAGYGMTRSGNFQAFIWSPSRGFAALDTLRGTSSYALSINACGVVVGGAQNASGFLQATVWKTQSVENLGTLGGSSSSAYGINSAGNIVGTSFTAGNIAQHGFIQEDGVMLDMNLLIADAPGWVITGLYAVNDNNQVVGVGLLDGVQHAVILTEIPRSRRR
jgi:probable HAF family extracellular repeat protein